MYLRTIRSHGRENDCWVVLMDRNQVRTAPGPQPQRGPPHVTDCGSGSPVAGGRQSRATGDPKLRLAHWNAEEVRQKKTELQNFPPQKTALTYVPSKRPT